MQSRYTLDEEPNPPKNSVFVPIAVGLLCAVALYWMYNHISGGCTSIKDIFTYCSGPAGSLLITK